MNIVKVDDYQGPSDDGQWDADLGHDAGSIQAVYWRPKKISSTITLLIGTLSIVALAVLEVAPRWQADPHRQTKTLANELAARCRAEVLQSRTARGLEVNRLFDPHRTGVIGKTMTSITSKPANLKAKQISVHPQFPAIVVETLLESGVRRGDTVAVGWTGSFPGLNIALAAAIESLELRVLPIASISASQYGANEPSLTWPDMEADLHRAGLIHFRSLAATIGGPADCGRGMSEEALGLVRASAERNDLPMLQARRLRESIDLRMNLIGDAAKEARIAAYINVGGGVASCGGSDCVFDVGASRGQGDPLVDCVMQRFAERDIPVVHLARPLTLAERFGISDSEESWLASSVVPGATGPSRLGAGVILILLCLILRAVILKDTATKFGLNVLRFLKRGAVLRAVGQVEGAQLMA